MTIIYIIIVGGVLGWLASIMMRTDAVQLGVEIIEMRHQRIFEQAFGCGLVGAFNVDLRLNDRNEACIDDAQAVVDPELRVRDGRGGVVRGLRVVDASVMPTITSGNTNSPTLMLAEKAAQWLAHEALTSS